MSKFFVQPAGDISGMKAIRFSSMLFAVLHFTLILRAHAPSGILPFTAAISYLCALGLFWWAIRTNGDRHLSAAFSPDVPEHLVSAGPYRWVRHPFYSSYLITWAAGIAASGSLWLLPTFLVMLFLYRQAARAEETKFSHSSLANQYRRYRETTGCFFPNPVKAFAGMRKDQDALALTEYPQMTERSS